MMTLSAAATAFDEPEPIAGSIGPENAAAEDSQQHETVDSETQTEQVETSQAAEAFAEPVAEPVAEPAGVQPTEMIVASEEPSDLQPQTPARSLKYWELWAKAKDTNREIASFESDLADLKEQVKDTKKELDAAQIRMRRVIWEMSELDSGNDPGPDQTATANLVAGSSDAEASEATEESQANWQDTPTASLLLDVKGLGAKKLEAIIEAAPTAGKLEELRGEASRAHKSFREVLPKGCGQAIADAIEDRLVELVARMDTPPAHEQVEPRVESNEADDETAKAESESIDSDPEMIDGNADADPKSEAHSPADGEEYEDADQESQEF